MRRTLWTVNTIGLLGLCACGVTASGAEGTLAPLGQGAPETTTTIGVVESDERRWFLRHEDAIVRHRDDIETLLSQLADVDIAASRVSVCQTGMAIDDAASIRAHDADAANPHWVRSVDLARWMFAVCAQGDISAVTSIGPELTEELRQFDTWVAALGTPTG